jgi:cell division protein FtsB
VVSSRLSFRSSITWLPLILFAAVAAMTGDLIFGPRGLSDLAALQKHELLLQRLKDALADENSSLGETASRLRSDDRYLKQLIRSRLGYATPGEIVYRFAGRGEEP